MNGRTKRLVADRNFLGQSGEGMIRQGQMFDAEATDADAYMKAGLAHMAPGRPSEEDAAAATADDAKQKAAKASESKESTAKGKDGLEAWDGSISEEAYVSKYDSHDASDSVKEKVKLAKARIRAGVSQGANG